MSADNPTSVKLGVALLPPPQGRKTGIGPGYRSSWNLGGEGGNLHDAPIVEGTIEPGKFGVVTVQPLFPETWREVSSLLLMEGTRVIGVATHDIDRRWIGIDHG